MTPDQARAIAAQAARAGNVDPEASHYDLDRLCRTAIEAIATERTNPEALELVNIANELLDQAEREEWREWYA